MKKPLDWLDHRTGYRYWLTEAMYENIPGGSRLRYVWGSTLVFTFFVQVVTGMFLWMYYSPSTHSAWESVYYLDEHVNGGWLLRGIHHYAAQLMVVLLAIHLLQVVIDGAYKAPREVNFWIGLILMQIVLGLALTGYLLPWDQKGYWATKVATEIAGSVGREAPVLAVGGQDYGHLTLTRFFALHAGVLPALMVLFLVFHIAVFRRHSITAKVSETKPRPDQHFWPDQVLKDGLACLMVLLMIIGLAWWARAELGAPANGAETYSAARPEWYFLFLFQFLKYFPGEYGKLWGAIIIPGMIFFYMFLMPLVARKELGHRVNVWIIVLLLVGAGLLTMQALWEDYYAKLVGKNQFDDLTIVLDEIAVDLRKNGKNSKYSSKTQKEQIELRCADDNKDAKKFTSLLKKYQRYQKSSDFIAAVDQAERNAHRVRELAVERDPETGQLRPNIPPMGALELLRNDSKTQGPKLFRRYCASCHDRVDTAGDGIVTLRPLRVEKKEDKEMVVANGAPNLDGFASREWITGYLDPEKIAARHIDRKTWQILDAPYFGNTRLNEGEMVEFVTGNLDDLEAADQVELKNLIVALSAEAELPAQRTLDKQDQEKIKQGRESLTESFGCIECHKFHGEGDLGTAPDLTGYGSRRWMIEFISDPAHERFYGDNEDNIMPAFKPANDPNNQILTTRKIELIVDWLRGDWPEAP